MIRRSVNVSTLALVVLLAGLTACTQVGNDAESPAAEAQAREVQAVETPVAAPTEPAAAPEAPVPTPVEPEPADPGSAATGEGAREIASYGIPDVSPTAVGRLVTALGNDPGLISAEVDEEQGQLRVTFTAGVTDPQTILTALNQVEPSVNFVGVSHDTSTGEPPPGHNCGGCPRRNQCQHGH